MEYKRCFMCKKLKSTLDFHANKKHKDGLHSYCKDCVNARRDSRQCPRCKKGTTFWSDKYDVCNACVVSIYNNFGYSTPRDLWYYGKKAH